MASYRVRMAIGGALTAGALMTAPVVVPALAGVAYAAPAPAPAPSLNDAINAVKSAQDAHRTRVAAAHTQIKSGLLARNPSQVQSGLGQLHDSKRQLREAVEGIVRGALRGGGAS